MAGGLETDPDAGQAGAYSRPTALLAQQLLPEFVNPKVILLPFQSNYNAMASAGLSGQVGGIGGSLGAGGHGGPPPPPRAPQTINFMPQPSNSMWSNNSGAAIMPGQGSYYVPDSYIHEWVPIVDEAALRDFLLYLRKEVLKNIANTKPDIVWGFYQLATRKRENDCPKLTGVQSVKIMNHRPKYRSGADWDDFLAK